MLDPVPLVVVEPVPSMSSRNDGRTVPVTDCDEIPLDVEFELDEVDPVLPDEVLELSSPSTFTSGWSFAHEAR